MASDKKKLPQPPEEDPAIKAEFQKLAGAYLNLPDEPDSKPDTQQQQQSQKKEKE
jgi:hypothetical protein